MADDLTFRSIPSWPIIEVT